MIWAAVGDQPQYRRLGIDRLRCRAPLHAPPSQDLIRNLSAGTVMTRGAWKRRCFYEPRRAPTGEYLPAPLLDIVRGLCQPSPSSAFQCLALRLPSRPRHWPVCKLPCAVATLRRFCGTCARPSPYAAPTGSHGRYACCGGVDKAGWCRCLRVPGRLLTFSIPQGLARRAPVWACCCSGWPSASRRTCWRCTTTHRCAAVRRAALYLCVMCCAVLFVRCAGGAPGCAGAVCCTAPRFSLAHVIMFMWL